eukprot:PhF_6_TR43678/c0_g1_i1/m.67122
MTSRIKKLLWIGLDGTRPEALMRAKAPHIHTCLDSPGTLYSLHTDTGAIPISGPSWTTILKGIPYSAHGIPNNDFDVVGAKGDEYKSGLTLLREAGVTRNGVCASIGCWDGQCRILKHEDPNTITLHTTDQLATDAAIRILSSAADHKECPDALFVFLDNVDHMGHEKGHAPHVPEYIASIQEADSMIGSLLNEVTRRSTTYHDEDWLVVMVTDHGGTKTRDMPKEVFEEYKKVAGEKWYEGVHGLVELPMHRNGFLIVHDVRGACVPKTQGGGLSVEIIPPPRTIDIVPTVLKWFGVQQPEYLP